MENHENICEDMTSNPNLLSHFSHGMINSKWPLVCGGQSRYDNGSYHNSKDCFIIGQETNTFVTKLEQSRIHTASLSLPDSLWILGTYADTR